MFVSLSAYPFCGQPWIRVLSDQHWLAEMGMIMVEERSTPFIDDEDKFDPVVLLRHVASLAEAMAQRISVHRDVQRDAERSGAQPPG